jgi:MOSC domain-containing protein YiiM
MRLLSISSGKVMPLFGSHHPNYSTGASAIHKQSISNLASPTQVEITRLGVAGDEQADLSVHGGVEKAISYGVDVIAEAIHFVEQIITCCINIQANSLEIFTITNSCIQ